MEHKILKATISARSNGYPLQESELAKTTSEAFNDRQYSSHVQAQRKVQSCLTFDEMVQIRGVPHGTFRGRFSAFKSRQAITNEIGCTSLLIPQNISSNEALGCRQLLARRCAHCILGESLSMK